MIFKAALFDMDGVIVDTEPLHRKAYFEMFHHFGLQVSEDLYNSFTGKATATVCRELVDLFNLKKDPETLIARKRSYFNEFFDNDPDFDLIPGVRKLIENYYQHGITMVVASSASRATINRVFERFGLGKYFSARLSGAELKASKPHPEIFERAAIEAGEPRKDCIVIEDSTNGIKAANAAGIYCVAYKSQHSKDQDYTDAQKVITDFEEIYVRQNGDCEPI